MAIGSALCAMLFLFSALLLPQDTSLFGRIERLAFDNERKDEWKLERKFIKENSARFLWKRGEEEISVSITVLASLEEAAKEYRKSVNAVSIGSNKKVPNLGDESRLWANYTTAYRSAIQFRKDNTHVRVSGSPLRTIESLARLIAAEIQNSPGPEH